ncbi:MAG: hypothetical protein SYC29_13950 [Planctomycetota bacterium]|nr:hypothetical protein [Planctomycetota bacterium]
MIGYFRIVNALYWLALIVWSAALISAGVAAMNVFGTLDAMPLELQRYAAYPVDEHPRLAAGHIMEGVFFLVDVLQFIAAPITVLALIAQFVFFRVPFRRLSNILRAAALVIAAGLFAYHATMVAPEMNRELRLFWSAAEAGRIEEAAEHRRAFNACHPTADAILRLNLLLLLIAAGASAVALTPAPDRRDSFLEPPRLLES